MRFSTLLPLLLAAGVVQAQVGKGGQGKGAQGKGGQGKGAAAAAAAAQGKGQGKGNANQDANQNANQDANQNANGKNNNNNALALDPNNVQTNSQSDGLDGNAEAGQAASATDQANFINFCTGETLTNGLQVKQGSCNGIPMGKIPATTNMVSAVMVNPQNGDDVGENEAIKFQVQIANLNAGSFTNPDVTYYAAPQDLQGGNIVGHTHITVQDLGNLNPTQPPDANDFVFFKGINDAGDGNGLLAADLAEGLPAGSYRVCSMTSASNHQPVLMPVAQRGPQDDCARFTVGGGNGNANNQNGQGKGQGKGQGQAAAQQGQGKGQAAQGQAAAQQGQGKGQGQAAAQQGQGKGQAAQGQAAQGQAAQGQAAQGQGKGQAAQGQAAQDQAAQGQAAQGQGKGQAAQGQAAQGQGKGQGQAAQGQAAKGRGRGRFGRMKFAAREFVA